MYINHFIFFFLVVIEGLKAQSHEPYRGNNTAENLNTNVYKNEFDEIVYTPTGPALRSNVHLVKSGHHLNVKEHSVQIINTNTGFVCGEFNNETFKNEEFFLEDSYIKSAEFNSGWIAYAQIAPNDNELILSFSTNWIVPSPPTTLSNQTIYLFNAIESIKLGVASILQPVLQWGPSPAGGGNYWAICNWYVSDNGQIFHDSLIKVNSGDYLQGIVKLISKSSDTAFNYISTFAGIPGSKLLVNNIPQLIYAYEALEAYRIQNCTDYPADDKIKMSNIQIKINPSTPSYLGYAWTDNGNDCGQYISIVNTSSTNGEVDIYFRRKVEFQIYPNPVENILHITMNQYNNSYKIEIYDNLGNLMETALNRNSDYEFDIDFQNYFSGLYIMKFYYNDKIFTSKIIRK